MPSGLGVITVLHTPPPSLYLSSQYIFLLAMNGMLTSVSNYFFPLSDSTRLQITYNIHLCMFKQVNRDGARYELGWTSMGVCVCVCVLCGSY